MDYGEIAINFNKGDEAIYIKNNNDEIVTFSTGSTGTSDSFINGRKNAQEVMENGDFYVIGIGGYDGTNAGKEGVQTLQEVINSIPKLFGNYIQSIEQEGGYIKYVSNNFRTNNSDTNTINFKTINGKTIFGQDDIKI